MGWLAYRNADEDDSAWIFGGFNTNDAFAEARGVVVVPRDAEVQLQLGATAWLDLSPLAQLEPDALYRIIISNDLGVHYRVARNQTRGPLEEGAPYLAHLTGLRSLVLNDDHMTGHELPFLSKLTHLETLALVSKKLEPEALKHATALKKLKGLRLYMGESVSGEALAELGKFNRLENLFIGGRFGPGASPNLGAVTSLEKLTINSFGPVPDGFDALTNLVNLTELHFAPRTYTAVDLAFLPHLPKLKTAGIRFVLEDGEKVAAIAKAHQLSHLNVIDLIKGTDLSPLTEMTQLESLSLLRSSLSDEMIAPLAELTQLKAFRIASEPFSCLPNISDATMQTVSNMTELEELGLPFGNYTDEGLKRLEGLVLLKDLDLINNSTFTDAAMDSFLALPHLEALSVRASQFSMEGLEKLRDAPRLHTLKLFVPNDEQRAFMETFNAERATPSVVAFALEKP